MGAGPPSDCTDQAWGQAGPREYWVSAVQMLKLSCDCTSHAWRVGLGRGGGVTVQGVTGG